MYINKYTTAPKAYQQCRKLGKNLDKFFEEKNEFQESIAPPPPPPPLYIRANTGLIQAIKPNSTGELLDSAAQIVPFSH